MKIRITDLLDDYMDDRLPLDEIPDILPDDLLKRRKPHHVSRKKRGAQIVAAVLIIASISAAGGMKLWCGGAGKSLSSEPKTQDLEPAATAQEATPEPAPEESQVAVADTPLVDGGHFSTTISSVGDVLNVSVGNVTRAGSTYQLKVIIDTAVENVTGFLLEDYDAYLVLQDGTTETLSASSESTYSENPFLKGETFTFDDSLTESELEAATLYFQIRSITLSTTDATAIYFGQWDMCFSETGIMVTTGVSQEQLQGEVPTIPENQVFSITDLNVSATGCTFWLHTTAEQFTLVPQGQLALAAEQDRDEIYYGFSLLTDGTLGAETVTIDSTTMSNRGVTDTQNLVYCTVTWKETIEPTSITGLYFTDGTAGQTVDVNAYVY